LEESEKIRKYRHFETYEVPPTMKAVVFKGLGFKDLAVEEVPVPAVGKNQLLCRVDAAGVCTSIIKILAQGKEHKYFNGWDPARYPVILGDEGSVTVVKVGENLKDRYRVGERYGIQPAVDIEPINFRERYRDNARGMKKCAVGYTLGGNLAQYILIMEEVLEAGCLIPLPADLPYFAVSMGEPISCVYSGQERNIHLYKKDPLSPRIPKLGFLVGGTGVVIGAGVMGRIHVEMAMRFRPRNLIVSDINRERLKKVERQLGNKARRLGINLVTVGAEELGKKVFELSGGNGADDVILAVGVQAVQQDAFGLLGKGGVINLFGGLPKGKNILQLDAIQVHYDEIKVVGSSGGEPSDIIATLKAMADGDIDPGNYVYGVGVLDHAPMILKGIEENRVDGKAILYPHISLKDFRRVEYWDGKMEEELLGKWL